MATGLVSAPTIYADVPARWCKWTRVTLYPDSGAVTWAFGWCGTRQGHGKAGSVKHALSQIEREAARRLERLTRRPW